MTRFMIAGEKSGCGKTTVTCAVLAALKARGISAAAFKCGPDYIDPMFHRETAGAATCNLDRFFCGDDMLLHLISRTASGVRTSLIEGVMGFYDGGDTSAHAVSQLTCTPAVIVIDCGGMSDSIGAVMSGFLHYRPNRIAGFIFSKLPPSLVPMVKRLCEELGTEYFGCLPKTDLTFKSRHLGLVTAAETEDIAAKLAALGELAEQHIELDRLLTLGGGLPKFEPPVIPRVGGSPVIAVADDRAFCFTYPETLSLLEEMGCRILRFSPMSDSAVPDADGLILSGGYPELHAAELSANGAMLADIREKISGGLPTIAECGGFMYLHERLRTDEGVFPMAGVIRGEAFPTGRLTRFGYVTLTAENGGLLCGEGGTLRAHEFHYFDSENCGGSFTAVKRDGRSWQCVHHTDTLYAGFPHLYLCGDIAAAESFARACADRRK